MIEGQGTTGSGRRGTGSTRSSTRSSARSSARLSGWLEVLRGFDGAGVDDGERVEQLRALEELKAACAAAQAKVTTAFAASQRSNQEAAGVRAGEVGKGVGAQVALARRDSPHKGNRHLGLAQALVAEMPHTLAALEAGQISEWRATLLVRETACLTRADRTRVDTELATRPGGLGSLGDATLVREAKRIAYRLDPAAVVRRHAKAKTERRVTIRPAPDTMTYVTGLLPADQGVAAYAALTQAADAARAAGDQRTRGQVMADTFVERLTGQQTAQGVAVEVNLVIPTDTLLGQGTEPGQLHGYGPVPATIARDLALGLREGKASARRWLRRLFTHPSDGQLVAMESTRRTFPTGLGRFIDLRDQSCRRPWCDAPIRHRDHVIPAEADGRTTATNGQGLCEACNHTKQAPGWTSRPLPDGSILTTTPTGHTYRSHAPPLTRTTGPPTSVMEARFQDFVLAS